MQVTVAGPVTTGGRDAYAIVAQSIGGGGGAVIGGLAQEGSAGATGIGDGGTVSISTSAGTKINTTGDGGFGIIAQSIGGGGGLAGDFGGVTATQAVVGNTKIIAPGYGTGAAVTLKLDQTALYTTGRDAFGIFAQSLGGGGGIVAKGNTLYRGGANGTGNGGGIVTVALTNSTISATGTGSSGIVVDTNGNNSGAAISLDSSSQVIAGTPKDPNDTFFGAILIYGGANNTVNNAGVITALPTGNSSSVAIISNGSVAVTNSGTINGIIATNQPSIVNNLASGVLNPRDRIQIAGGTLVNAGTLIVGGSGVTGPTTLTGNLVQSSTGVIQVDVDAVAGKADLLTVTGAAQLGGTIRVNPLSFRKGLSAPVIVAAGGITVSPTLLSPATALFRQTSVLTATSLAIETSADFRAADPGLSRTQASLAGYLQRVFDRADPGFDAGLARLAGVADRAGYLSALEQISGAAVVSMAAVRYEASQSFARATYGCPTFGGDGTIRTEHGCVWLRAAGNWATRDRDAGFRGYDWSAGTIKLGGQREIGADLFLGGSVGYETGKLHDRLGLTRIESDAVLAAVSLTHQRGPWTLAAAADFGLGWFKSRRSIPLGIGGEARANSTAFNAGLHSRAAYRFAGQRMYLEPAVELDVNYLSLSGYRESGGTPFNLRVRSSHDWVFAATPGARVGTRADIGPGRQLDLHVGAGASFLHGNNFATSAAFTTVSAEAGAFQTRLDNDNVAARLTAGLQLVTVRGFDIQLQYEGRLSSRQTDHGGQAKLTYRF